METVEKENQNLGVTPIGIPTRPVYLIAHRVLTVKGVDDAISHGANAIEIDFTAWRKGWWADHDGFFTSYGDTAKDILERVVSSDRRRQIAFVWFDIKNPDYTSDPSSNSSVETLRRYARDILEVNGISVLYGFYEKPGGRAWNVITSDLNRYEAVCISGKAEEVLSNYDKYGSHIRKEKRIMDYGYFEISYMFSVTKRELREGSMIQRQSHLGKVFGWTTATGHAYYVDHLLSCDISGLIYGFKMTHYYDHSDTRSSASDIINWVKKNENTHKIANRADFLW